MTTTAAALKHYAKHRAQTRDPKDQEYDVILGVTRALAEGQKKQDDYPAFVKSLNDNERLWIEIGTQVASPDNRLPDDLRARLFYMAEFVGQQTAKVLAGSAPVQGLIEVNVAVLRGLKGKN